MEIEKKIFEIEKRLNMTDKINESLKIELEETKKFFMTKTNRLENKIIILKNQINNQEVIHQNILKEISKIKKKICDFKQSSDSIEKQNNFYDLILRTLSYKLSTLLEKNEPISGNENEIGMKTKKIDNISEDISNSVFYQILLTNNIFKEFRNYKIKFLFKASENAFSSLKFHEICDNYTDTIVFVKNDLNEIFGGYTNLKWTSSNQKYEDEDHVSFLFSIDPNEKLPLINHTDMTILCQYNYGPTFGSGYDLYISHQCNENKESYYNFGYSFQRMSNPINSKSKNFSQGKKLFKVL